MFGTSWRVGRIAGIEVRVDSSWVVIALLITYSLYLRFSLVYPSLSTGGAVGIAILAAALFWVVDVLGRDVLSRPLVGAFGYLAWVNLLLAGFNLVPGFPLDGGRLLRSAIWKATGSFGRATRIASVAGQAVGWLLVAGGVAYLLAGNLAGGIWFAFIGWFLVQAARASYEELQLRHLLRGVEARDVMASNLLRIPPDLTLQDAVDDYFMRYAHGAFPVEEQGRTI